VYFYNYKKWQLYASARNLSILPGSKDDIGEFLIGLVESQSLSSIRLVTAGINFFHRLYGFEPPCGMVLDGLVNDYVAKHSSKNPRIREPFLLVHLEKILDVFSFETCSLYFLRSLGIIIIGFFGFLRFSDFSNLTLDDVLFCKDKVVILLKRSKTDRLKIGQQVIFDRESFPAHFLEVYFHRFGFQAYKAKSEFFVFMSMRLNKLNQCLIFRDEKMSFNSCTRVLKHVYEKAGIQDKGLSSHSLRIGGATEASRLGVPDFKIGRNGRWVSDSSRRLYQRDPGTGKDSVSMVLTSNLSK